MADYGFAPLTRADYPLMRGWLAQPHVRAWWGDPDDEIAMIDSDIDTGPTDMRIVTHAGQPFAYVQDYPAHHWPMPHYADFPEGTRAMDTFLGEPSMLGQGHAARYLRARAKALLAQGAAAVVMDPSPDNAGAVRAYRAAGFVGDEIRQSEEDKPVLVLAFHPD
ncbi:GNAT family N-acetyltransferase [Mesobacterium pallidum]|uniref:GNAT family N-acetyltransferase n=1 Tax=Mesobacterium pallidum TaxID=2872037 RepID=UPI001EE240AB|nr:GNAT family N-acetyltransferase [Mesobacterium pallidum]